MMLREWLVGIRAFAEPGREEWAVSEAIKFWRDHAFDDFNAEQQVIRNQRQSRPYQDRPDLDRWQIDLDRRRAQRRVEVIETVLELEREGFRILTREPGR